MKPRSDSQLNLHRECLKRWLMDERISYDEAKKRLREQFDVRTSSSALSGFWHRECGPAMLPAAQIAAQQRRLLACFARLERWMKSTDRRLAKFELKIARKAISRS